MGRNPFGVAQWIAWLGATVAAAVTLTGFAYQNFQTKDDARHVEETLIRRLDLMETKLDAALERK